MALSGIMHIVSPWYSIISTQLGWVYVVVSSHRVRALGIVSSYAQAYSHAIAQKIPDQGAEPSLSPVWVTDQVRAYLSGCDVGLFNLSNCALDLRATPFQSAVYHQVCAIRPGHVLRYYQVAQAIGRPRAVRAVARALATNAVSLIIPCHRVVAQRDGLGGYRWGCAQKQWLLTLEAKWRTDNARES